AQPSGVASRSILTFGNTTGKDLLRPSPLPPPPKRPVPDGKRGATRGLDTPVRIGRGLLWPIRCEPHAQGQVPAMRKPNHRLIDATARDVAGPGLSRRRWLKGAVLVYPGLALPAWGQAPSKSSDDASEQVIIDRVQETARKAGLGPLSHKMSEHFLGLGDASPRFQSQALLQVCEPLSKAFLA